MQASPADTSLKYPPRSDNAPRAVWPQGLDHLTAIARAIDRATLWPFVITLRYRGADGQATLLREVVERPAGVAPLGMDLLPADALELFRADVLPASRFDDMTPHVRGLYAAEYRAYLMWRKAKALGKAVAELKPWTDYDPISDDGRVHRWVGGASGATL